MTLYEEIAHKLYVWNTKIDETTFQPFDFIEAMHQKAPFKGKVFYQNLIQAMPNHFGAKMRKGFFEEVIQYCQDKINKSPSDKIQVAKALHDMENAGILTYEQQQRIIHFVKNPVVSHYGIIKEKYLADTADSDKRLLHLFEVLVAPYVSLPSYINSTLALQKRFLVDVKIKETTIKGFFEDFRMQARFLKLKHGAEISRVFVDYLANAFGDFERSCNSISQHKFETNVYKSLISAQLNALEHDFGTTLSGFPRIGVEGDGIDIEIIPDAHKIQIRSSKTYLMQEEIAHEANDKQELGNDYTRSTIEDYLEKFKDKMTESDYETLVSALIRYLETGAFPLLKASIQINRKANQKRFGWALNQILRAHSKGVDKAVLLFIKGNVSLYANTTFDENDFLNCNLYKYLTTKTE